MFVTIRLAFVFSPFYVIFEESLIDWLIDWWIDW